MCSLDPTSAAFASHGRYYCHFLGRHPDDTSFPDPVCRWWPLWHRFTRAADGTFEYHNRILFTPTTLPDATLYVAWADVLPLLDPNICLFGPFSFSDPAANPPGRTPSFRQFLAAPLWASLTTSCLSRGISPPIIACPLPFAPDGLALLDPVPTLLDRRLPLLPDCCLPADRCPTDAPLSSAADLC